MTMSQRRRLFKTQCLGACALAGQRAASVGYFREGGREMLDEEIETFVEDNRMNLLKLLGGTMTPAVYKAFLKATANKLRVRPIFVLFGEQSVEAFYQELLAAAAKDYGDEVAGLLTKG
jgi:hypothetical protein